MRAQEPSSLFLSLAIDATEKRLPVQTSMPAYFATYNQRVDALAWSPDSTRIASALGNDTVDVCSIKTGDAMLFPFSPPGNVNAVAWSPDGASIAAVSGNISIQVRSATTGDLSLTYTGHGQAVLTLAWSPDGKQIASGGVDGIVQVWDAARGYTYMTYRGHIAEVNAVAWSPDSKQIASGGTDGTVQVWDAATGSILFTYRGHAGGVNTVAWQPQQPLLSGHEARIASGGADATVQVWSFGKAMNTNYQQAMALQGRILIYRGHAGPVTSVSWIPTPQARFPVWGTGMADGQLIASGSEDGTVQVWQAK